jgi:hypothetical protein
MDFSLASLKKNLQNLEDRFPGKIHVIDNERIEGTSENPGWVSRGSSKKIAHSLIYKELRKRNFLQRVRK